MARPMIESQKPEADKQYLRESCSLPGNMNGEVYLINSSIEFVCGVREYIYSAHQSRLWAVGRPGPR